MTSFLRKISRRGGRGRGTTGLTHHNSSERRQGRGLYGSLELTDHYGTRCLVGVVVLVPQEERPVVNALTVNVGPKWLWVK